MIDHLPHRTLQARLILAVAGILAAAAALFVPLSSSDAATPGAGTVSATNTFVTWTGALMAPNPNGCTGANDTNCDLYRLTVQPPASSLVRIELQPAGDWDLAVYGPDGGLVGSSGNGPGQMST